MLVIIGNTTTNRVITMSIWVKQVKDAFDESKFNLCILLNTLLSKGY